MEYSHRSVMLPEVLAILNPQVGQIFIDCTAGGGGYSVALAKAVGDKGKVLALDADSLSIEELERLRKLNNLKQIIVYHGNFKDLQEIANQVFGQNISINGIVYDLGLSSAQLADRNRGFSFLASGPLNMAFGLGANNTEEIVNHASEEELKKIIGQYGQERFARRIAKSIINYRKKEPIKTTEQLVKIIGKSLPAAYQRGRIHYATRTFQALRIATNQELENLENSLPQAFNLLALGGKLIVLSYHSLEDRIVKNFFKSITDKKGDVIKARLLTKKPIYPSENEIKENSRSRSARLRAIERIN